MQHLVEPSSASPAKIEMPSACASLMSSGSSFSMARQPETWKPPIMTCTPARARSARYRGRGEFVRLHADQADQAEAAVLGDAPRDLARAHAGIGLVDGHDVDRSRARAAAARRAERKAIDRGKRVRRHGRAQPLHDIAVVVVMRRLDRILKRPLRFHHPPIKPIPPPIHPLKPLCPLPPPKNIGGPID